MRSEAGPEFAQKLVEEACNVQVVEGYEKLLVKTTQLVDSFTNELDQIAQDYKGHFMEFE